MAETAVTEAKAEMGATPEKSDGELRQEIHVSRDMQAMAETAETEATAALQSKHLRSN